MFCFICATASVKPFNFESKDQLEAHISGCHFNFAPYKCIYCPFNQFPTEHLLKCHHDSIHQLQPFKVLFFFINFFLIFLNLR